MKKFCFLAALLLGTCGVYAETITAHFYGSEIDCSQKYNPCKGNTGGGVKVTVVTNVTAVQNAPERTVVERTYKLSNGEILKTERNVVNSPKPIVLHKMFPRQFPKVKL